MHWYYVSNVIGMTLIHNSILSLRVIEDVLSLQVEVDTDTAVNVSQTLKVIVVDSASDLKPKDLKRTVQVVGALARTIATLDSQDLSEVSRLTLYSRFISIFYNS